MCIRCESELHCALCDSGGQCRGTMGTALFGGTKLIPAASQIPEPFQRGVGDVAAAFPCGSTEQESAAGAGITAGLTTGKSPGPGTWQRREGRKLRAPLQVSLGWFDCPGRCSLGVPFGLWNSGAPEGVSSSWDLGWGGPWAAGIVWVGSSSECSQGWIHQMQPWICHFPHKPQGWDPGTPEKEGPFPEKVSYNLPSVHSGNLCQEQSPAVLQLLQAFA